MPAQKDSTLNMRGEKGGRGVGIIPPEEGRRKVVKRGRCAYTSASNYVDLTFHGSHGESPGSNASLREK